MIPRPDLTAIKQAAKRIEPYIHRTPVCTSETLNDFCGGEVFLKCENFQKVGAFKARGATNAVFSLSEKQAAKGVLTHSSGNHAGALAWAAKTRGINAEIVMPENAPQVKLDAVKGYGANVYLSKPTQAHREALAAEVAKKTGATMVHPYNDHLVMAGQGTAALELLDQVSDLDLVLTPVGGGGLISGTALAVKGISEKIEVVGVEPQGANFAWQSLQKGEIVPQKNPNTVADGLLTAPGDLTFPVLQEYVSRIVTVSDEEIISAMRLVWERMKIIIEPSSAVPVAGLLTKKVELKGKRAGVIISGGNVDLASLPWQ